MIEVWGNEVRRGSVIYPMVSVYDFVFGVEMRGRRRNISKRERV